MFDMGGVIIRDFQVAPKLLPFLGREETQIGDISPEVKMALRQHSKGLIGETEFWKTYQHSTSMAIPPGEKSLLGKFFTPVLDAPTIEVIEELKRRKYRVICGTNVIDAHFRIHNELHQYDIFDQVYASHHMHLAKPEGTFYQYILEMENVSPHEMFFTDDMQENVLSARNEGLVAYTYSDAHNLRIQLVENGVL
jgi:putative hydrolase of the HAD superfamily